MAEKIRILKIAPLEKPEVIEVEHTLEVLQNLVGGTVQAVYPWEDPVGLLCDDNGKGKGYPPNRALVDENGELYDIIVGTFYITGLTEDSFGSLSDVLVKKFTERFRYPELFMRTMDDHVVWIRMKPGEKPRVIA